MFGDRRRETPLLMMRFHFLSSETVFLGERFQTNLVIRNYQQQQQSIPVNHGLHNPPPSDPVVSVGPGQNVSAPRRGRGVLQQQQPGMRVPMCGSCNNQIRFVREWRVEDVSLLTFYKC